MAVCFALRYYHQGKMCQKLGKSEFLSDPDGDDPEEPCVP